MTTEQLNEFKEIAKPVIKYLCENFHPHTTVVITPTGAELLEAQMATGPILEFIKD